jgi:hypothetical protein
MSRKTAILVISVIIAVLTAVLTACNGSDPTDSPVSPLNTPSGSSQEPDLVETLAPIDSVEIIIAESWPPQYFLLVRSGLPSGCVKFDRYEVTRHDNAIEVAVINLEPVGEVVCTTEYGMVEHNIPLGSDFEPGATYIVQVNEVTETLVAQGGAGDLGPVSATLDNPFQLEVGQTALLEPQGLGVEFLEVVEDSRCPMGVECVWAGQALILIRVSGEGDAQELTLQLGPKDSVTGVYESYSFDFLALDPYPQAPGQDAPPQPAPTATLVVSQ